MKKFLGLALITMLLAFVQAHASAPTYSATNAAYAWEFDSARTSAAFDTLAATDSTTFLSKWTVDPGWEYIMVRDAITGTGSDSVAIQIRVDMYDNRNNLLYSVAIDSLTAAAGEAISIPVGGSLFGSKMTVKGLTYTGAGTQAIINRYQIVKRRPVTIQKAWTIR